MGTWDIEWDPSVIKFFFENSFKSEKDKTVVGVYREKEIQELNINDKEICKKYNLNISEEIEQFSQEISNKQSRSLENTSESEYETDSESCDESCDESD